MFFWSVKRLARDLRDGTVADRHLLINLLVFVLLYSLAADPYLNSLLEPATSDASAATTIASTLITFFGTVVCFRSSPNRQDAAGFVTRYVCLTVPITIQIVVLGIPLCMLAYFLATLSLPDWVLNDYFYPTDGTWFDFAATTAIQIAYFAYLRAAVRWSYA